MGIIGVYVYSSFTRKLILCLGLSRLIAKGENIILKEKQSLRLLESPDLDFGTSAIGKFNRNLTQFMGW